jgi:mannose-1-phosphate guanylyltransferase
VLPSMILAAGYGTRLRPLTDLVPKPLVPVGDRPALAHILDRLAAGGVSRTVVNAHVDVEAFDTFAEAWNGRGRAGAPPCVLSREPELLGTAGGLAKAAGLLGDGAVVVWNGDVLAPLEVGSLIARHGKGEADGTLVVQPLAKGTGNVGLDARGRLVRFRDQHVGASPEVEGGFFVGVHVVGPRVRARLPERGCLVADVYLPLLAEGARLESFRWDAPLVEIGNVADYLDANLAWLEGEGLESWIGPATSVHPAVLLDRSVVSAGASVGGSGALERCVVWAGAHAEAPLADAVVLPGAVVRAVARAPHAKGIAHP